ncbi:hypothetical protein OH77DRAFT_1377394, partial [Trametes cingulata]
VPPPPAPPLHTPEAQPAAAPQSANFTPAPADGFLRPNFADPESLLAGLSQLRIAALQNEPPNSLVLVQIFNVNYPSPTMVNPLTEDLLSAIGAITGERDPFIVPPEPDWSVPAARRALPRTWIVLRLSSESVERLVTQIVWSSPAITFFAYRREPAIPRFLFTLSGYTRDRDSDVFQAVWRVFSSTEVRDLTLELVQANPDFASVRPGDALNAILASLIMRVNRLSSGNLVAAVYCDSPTRSVQRWRDWRDQIGRNRFPTALNYTGFRRHFAPCDGCHANDHVTHLCPYPLDVPGWHAPRA